MARKRAKDRMKNEVNAGSMADIAFLLLIFFLVTTTIDVDKGVLVKLPPWSDEPPEDLKMTSRNIYSVLVNANNELLVRGEPSKLSDLRSDTKEFIMNPRKMDDMAEDPRKAIISLKNDRGTSYETYLEVYNESIFDLLTEPEKDPIGRPLPRKQLRLKEESGNVVVKGLRELAITSVAEGVQVFFTTCLYA